MPALGKVYVGIRGLFTISDAFYEASEEVEPKLYDPNW